MREHTAYDLVAEARANFGELSAAEQNVLRAVQSGEVAYCGPSDKADDTENDPSKAAGWDAGRTIRARLIRWLCVDPEASKRVDPQGIQVHAARIGDPANEKDLELYAISIPFPLVFVASSFQVPIRLTDASIKGLHLTGSRIPALRADRVEVSGSVLLNEGFQSDGEVQLSGAAIGGQVAVDGARFGDASVVDFENARVKQAFIWRNLAPGSQLRLNLVHASVGPIVDDEQSWPERGKLLLDGFVYQRIGGGPTDEVKRLEWLARQPDGFIPQPYQQLAKVLREAGDDKGARKVLIAMENSRLEHGHQSVVQQVSQWLLWATVGYGYVPLRPLWYLGFLVLLGTSLFSWGHMAHVIVPTERDRGAWFEPFNPFIYSIENSLPLVDLGMAKRWRPDPNAKPIALVWPFSETPSQTPASLGGFLRWYLWVHIMLGWFFSAMFLAGITGLVRRE